MTSNKEIEHPKPLIEVMANTREAVEGYALVHNISTLEAGLVLMFNELRCIHWHFDKELTDNEAKKSKPKS